MTTGEGWIHRSELLCAILIWLNACIHLGRKSLSDANRLIKIHSSPTFFFFYLVDLPSYSSLTTGMVRCYPEGSPAGTISIQQPKVFLHANGLD